MAKKKSNGLTRQGVRDLSGLKAPPRGRFLETPPSEAIACEHKLVTDSAGNQSCRKCFARDEELFVIPRY